jgi:septum formation protein
MMNLPKLILASASPRRSEILTAVGWDFTKHSADIDETELPGESPSDYVQRLAKEKAEAVAANYQNALVLGADTTVVIENQIIGKPKDFDDARRMLQMLSGNWHEVLTGVALVKTVEPLSLIDGLNPKSKIQNPKSVVGIQKTKVKFAKMTDAQIEFLIEHGEPLDKAGAYAVQAQAALFIEQIQGDYWNVVGLPVSLVHELLKEI